MLTNDEITDLIAVARAATAGPWRRCGQARGGCACGSVYGTDMVVAMAYATCEVDELETGDALEQKKRNAAFIAAFNPSVVLALLNELQNERLVPEE